MLMKAKRTDDGSFLAEINEIHQIHDSLEVPDGFRAEIIEGQITVAASPFGKHAAIIVRIRRATQDALPPGYELFEVTTAQAPNLDRYIPDLAAWPFELIDKADADWVFSATECEFAVEVTSPGQQERDYEKASGYAISQVPMYLLVDRSKRECVVFTEPNDGQYLNIRSVPFGEPLELALHKTVTIDTSKF